MIDRLGVVGARYVEFAAQDRLEAKPLTGLVVAYRREHVGRVGERHRLHAACLRLLGQLLDLQRAQQERILAVNVKMDELGCHGCIRITRAPAWQGGRWSRPDRVPGVASFPLAKRSLAKLQTLRYVWHTRTASRRTRRALLSFRRRHELSTYWLFDPWTVDLAPRL